MLDFDLMNIFNGFIRNYANFGLNKNSSRFEAVKREIKYFIMLGQFLGYSVMHKGINNDDEASLSNIEVAWKDYDFNTLSSSSIKLQLFREDDLVNDLEVIQNLLYKVKEDPDKAYVQILETSSNARIDYLNNIINTSYLEIKKDMLVIYIIRDILNDKSYYNGYLFEKGKITKKKIGICYSDVVGEKKAVFKF
ncbi:MULTISPECIES: hypothetical protein [Clostridium]|uniref:hypothetical protein n=1 Tax=Clostridium TaxID=1485 RepID=UPI00189B4C18|nr:MULTISPECIES: hypothetical protein [Clostridium]MCR1949778.1 hypothetical protein [Clostridium sp. DSM 100503]MDI9215906.1 hypothetical protein [Clostridium tertium]